MMESQEAKWCPTGRKRGGVEAIWDRAEHKLFVLKDPWEAEIKTQSNYNNDTEKGWEKQTEFNRSAVYIPRMPRH